ncbi:MAG: hypothetical protein ACOYZ8_18965 [Chloroflexota bacterium]
MNRRTVFILTLVILAGLIPVTVYWLETGNLQTPDLEALPGRCVSPSAQMAQALAGLVIKPVYMMLSLFLIILLIGQRDTDIAALQWGLIAFLVGEVFCAVNFYIYRHESILSEYIHSYGMAVAFGLVSFALLEGLDARLLRLTSSMAACEALRVCGQCTRHSPAGCKAKAITQFALPMLAALTFIPLLSPLLPDAYAVSIFGFPYSYTRLDVYELYERRVLPLLALAAFVLAWLPLLKKGEPPIPFLTRALACAGLGALGFSFFRVTLNAIFADNLVWFEFWEEATELMFTAAVGFVLWQFRRSLLKQSAILEVFFRSGV